MNTAFVQPGERLDELQPYGLSILQRPKEFCFGTDAVLLAHFARAKAYQRVLDLGTGTGILPLLMTALFAPKSIVGVEIQPPMAELAARSVRYNELQTTIRILSGDYTRRETLAPLGQFDVVVCNPPYGKLGHGAHSEDTPHALARFEICAQFSEICQAAQKALVSMGRFYCIHQASRLPELLETLHAHTLVPKRLRFVHGGPQKTAGFVLIESIKGGRANVKVEPPLFLTGENGQTSPALEAVYQGGLL